jgi:G3E family GTPase
MQNKANSRRDDNDCNLSSNKHLRTQITHSTTKKQSQSPKTPKSTQTPLEPRKETNPIRSQNKPKKVLRLEPISKLKDRMRRIVWQENVQNVIKYSHEKPVIRRLEKLLAA